MNDPNELKHYGILGMRWGSRRSALKRLAERASAKGAAVKARFKKDPENPSESHIKSRSLLKKKLSEMTDDEIKQVSTRLRLEREYKELTKRNTSAAEKAVGEAIVNAAKNTLQAYLQKYATEGAQKLVTYIMQATAKKEG